MHTTENFADFLSLYREMLTASYLTDEEFRDVLTVCLEHFTMRAHDARLQAIVVRLCREALDDRIAPTAESLETAEVETVEAASGPAEGRLVS